MPKFLNNIDLNSNQLLSPVIHVSSQSTATNGPAGNTTGTEGQIFYNSHAKALYFRDDSAWRPIGDISGVSAGVGLSGGGTGGDVTLTIDFSEFSDVTPVNGDKLATLDSDGSTEQLTTIASLATLFAGSGLTATNSVIAVDTLNQSTTGSAGTVTDIGSMNAGDVTSGGTNNRTLTLGDAKVTMAKLANIATDTFIGRTAANAGVPKALSKAEALAILNVTDGANVNTDVSVSSANLKDTLEAGFPDNAVSLGDSGDTITVPGDVTVSGDLTVTGDTITVNTTTLTVKDPLIVIANNNAADTIDTGFFSTYVSAIGEGSATQRYTGLFRDASVEGDPYTFFDTTTIEPGLNTSGSYTGIIDTSHASFKYAPIKAGIITATTNFAGPLTGAVTGNASTATKIASITNSNIVQLAETQTLTNKTLTSPTLTTPALGTPASGTLTNCTFPTLNQNTSGTAAGLSATLAVASGGTGATSLDSAGIVEKSGAQTIAGTKTFSSGIVLDDGSGASPVLKFKNEADTHWTVQNDNSNNLKFTQATDLRVTFNAGGDVTIPGSIDLGGSIDVDGTMEADAITLGGSSVHATDTSTSLGTSDTVVPSQKAVKTYVDAQGSSSSNTGGRNAFVLNDSVTGVAVSNSNKTYTITHGMGTSLNYGVEVFRAVNGSGETVYTDVTRTTTTIVIEFAVAPTAGDYTALVCKY